MNNKLIGERIKYCRELHKETLDDLGKLCGVHKSTVSRWESGETEKIGLPTIALIARHYGVSEAWIAGKDVAMYDSTATLTPDAELQEYLEELKNREEMRMLFKTAKGTSKEDIEKAVAIIEALRGTRNE